MIHNAWFSVSDLVRMATLINAARSSPVDKAVGLDISDDVARGPLVLVELLGDQDPQLHPCLLIAVVNTLQIWD